MTENLLKATRTLANSRAMCSQPLLTLHMATFNLCTNGLISASQQRSANGGRVQLRMSARDSRRLCRICALTSSSLINRIFELIHIRREQHRQAEGDNEWRHAMHDRGLWALENSIRSWCLDETEGPYRIRYIIFETRQDATNRVAGRSCRGGMKFL